MFSIYRFDIDVHKQGPIIVSKHRNRLTNPAFEMHPTEGYFIWLEAIA
jgi:hypothetical protein